MDSEPLRAPLSHQVFPGLSDQPLNDPHVYRHEENPMSEAKSFGVGDRVRLALLPPYVKTADPMPMLRPPNVIQLGEEGVILDRRPGGYWGVRFTQGVFLMDEQYLEFAAPP